MKTGKKHLIRSGPPAHGLLTGYRGASFKRTVNYIFAHYISQNIAFLYFWLPLVLTIWGHFFYIDRPFFVVSGYFAFAVIQFLAWRQNALCLPKNWMLWLFASYGLLIFASIAMLSRTPLISFWFLFVYVILPFFIGMKLGHQVKSCSISPHFSLLMAVCIFVIGENVFEGGDQRVLVFGGQSNSVQLSLVCAFIFSFVFAGAWDEKMRPSSLLMCILLSGFVSGAILPRWFSLASFFILLVSVCFGRNYRFGAALVLVFIAGWLIGLLCVDGRLSFYFENLVPRAYAINGDHDLPITSIEERIRLFFTGLELFLRNPILGVGVGNFGYASGGAVNSFPHLSLVHVASELGVFVLSLYMVVIGCAGILLAHASKFNHYHFPWLSILLYGIIFSLLHGNYLTDKLIYVALGYASSLVPSSNCEVRPKTV